MQSTNSEYESLTIELKKQKQFPSENPIKEALLSKHIKALSFLSNKYNQPDISSH